MQDDPNDAAEHVVELTQEDTLSNAPIIEATHAADELHAAEEHRAAADVLQHEQAIAADHGDYAHAHDLAWEAGYELHAVADHGGDPTGSGVIEGEHELQALDLAHWNQQIADENSTSAASYAASGDAHGAEVYEAVAESHAETAADYGHAGDHGGEYAAHDSSHDVAHDASTDAGTDASASSE